MCEIKLSSLTLLLLVLTSETDGKTTDTVPNGKEDEGEKQQEELEKGLKALSTSDTSESSVVPPTAPPTKPVGTTPEGSPSKSPFKKKKKFKAPSFLKKSKKQKEKAET